MERYDALVLGAGMGGLSVAALLANEGLKVGVLEQNWLPGGCSSAYPRKGFVFESGATTLVGLDEGQPLHEVLRRTGIAIDAWKLDIPMKVHLPDKRVVTRYQDIDKWIKEAQQHFPHERTEAFWRKNYALSKFVWNVSTRQLRFPPRKVGDLVNMALSTKIGDIIPAINLFQTVEEYGRGMWETPYFKEFIDEQLLITAQNTKEEVNLLFGAAALCYTNFGNYYMPGGLINMVQPFVDFIHSKGGEVLLRTPALSIARKKEGYVVKSKEESYTSTYLVSNLPLNNLEEVADRSFSYYNGHKAMKSEQLVSAFQMGLGIKKRNVPDCLHHQIHLKEPLPQIGSTSIFISFSHPNDSKRVDDPETMVASVSTHVFNPKATVILDKATIEKAIVKAIEESGLLHRDDILFHHSSTPGGWYKWTRRKWGFVGGYPQFKKIKPWDMVEARLDDKGAYLVGDSAYPGQGIPGVTLSGLVAFEKLKADWL